MNWNGPYQSRFLNVDPARGRFRVHRSAYADPKVFEEEKAKIFDKTWQFAGHESEVAKPGDYVLREFAGRRIILVRGKDGVVRGFLNTCPHRGAQVCMDRKGNRKTFVCPYHGWAFRNTGELVDMNAKSGYADPEVMNSDGAYSLAQVPRIETRAGFVFVNFDAGAEPLDDYLGPAGERLDLIADHSAAGMEVVQGCHEYTIKANYKLLCENSYDGYHLDTTHASYVDYLAGALKDQVPIDFSGKTLTLGNGHASIEVRIPVGRPIAQWIPPMGEAAKAPIEAKYQELVERLGEERADLIAHTSRNMVIFPNNILNDQQAVLVRSIVPVAHDEMLVRAWVLGPVDEPPELRRIRLDSALSFLGPGGFATPDDVEMLERCQIGFSNRDAEWNDFSKGFSADEETARAEGGWNDEMQMRAYWQQWNRMMTDETSA